LTFTAAKALTSAEVAAAFANLAKGATSGSAPGANGTYNGTFGNYTTGAVTTANGVSTFAATASSAATGNTAITVSDNSTNTIASANKTAGVTAVTAVTGVQGVVGGAVQVTDAGYNASGADTITTVSLNGYGAGGFVKSDALTSLSLANSAASLDVYNNTATSLSLSLNKVTGNINLDTAAQKYTTLSVATSGDKSAFGLTAAKVTALTVSGDKGLDLTGSTLTALKTVTATGAVDLTINASGANVTAVDTTGNTGTTTATVDASKATFTGGAGVDKVTLSSTTVSKAVSTGAGDDTVTLAAGTTALTANVDGGTGIDTLAMAAADAVTASQNSLFAGKIDGFEKLSLGQAASAVSINLANLDGISYVISAGGAPAIAGNFEEFTFSAPGFTEVGSNTTVTFDGYTYIYVAATYAAFGSAFFFAGDYSQNAILPSYTLFGNTFGGQMFMRATSAGNKTDVTSANFVVAGNSTDTGGPLAFTVSNVIDGTTASAAGELTLTNMANAGTLELTGVATTTTVTMTDATGSTDSFNIVTKVDTADLSFGTVAVAGVESISLTATDISTAGISKATLTLDDSAAKSVVITGNSDLVLAAAGSALKTVDASAFTGKLTFSSAVASATVTGGSANDTLTATGNNQTLNGGGGSDTLITTGNMTTMTGGAGADTFDVSHAASNLNSYAKITDLAAGDKIKFDSSSIGFAATKIELQNTAMFQDFADAAITGTGDGDISWFQFGGNTYAIENATSGSQSAFTNGLDIAVQLVGLVDLCTASFSSSAHTLQFN